MLLTGSNLMVDNGSGTFSTIYTMAGGSPTDVTVDGEGTLYVSCAIQGMFGMQTPCTSASVWAVSPGGSPFRPFVDGYSAVSRIGYDPLHNELVLLTGSDNLQRVPLKR